MKNKNNQPTELNSIVVRGVGYGIDTVTYQVLVNGVWQGITRKKIAELEAAHLVIHWNPSR